MTDASGWAYDPDWRAFTRVGEDGVQVVVYEEWTEGDYEFVRAFADEQGLGPDVRERLKANPAPLSYNGTSPAWLKAQ